MTRAATPSDPVFRMVPYEGFTFLPIGDWGRMGSQMVSDLGFCKKWGSELEDGGGRKVSYLISRLKLALGGCGVLASGMPRRAVGKVRPSQDDPSSTPHGACRSARPHSADRQLWERVRNQLVAFRNLTKHRLRLFLGCG